MPGDLLSMPMAQSGIPSCFLGTPSRLSRQRIVAEAKLESIPELASGQSSSVQNPAPAGIKLISPQMGRGKQAEPVSLMLPQLTRQDVEVRPERLRDRVPLLGKIKLVDYRDLERRDLFPKYATNLSSLEKPILASRQMLLDHERLACILYVPSVKGHIYSPAGLPKRFPWRLAGLELY